MGKEEEEVLESQKDIQDHRRLAEKLVDSINL
jgi:hypothetical protein